MAATPSLRVIKTFTYRGQLRRWSNRYHFNGGMPNDAAHWTTFSDAVVTAEKACLDSLKPTTIVQTIGYAAGSDVPVYTKNYSTIGTLNAGTAPAMPGDVAALIRYATTARTSKNHPIYLYNYYHGIHSVNASTPDSLLGSEVTAFGAYAAAWIAGFSDGTNSYVRAGPNGATATGYLVEALLTHRDLPR